MKVYFTLSISHNPLLLFSLFPLHSNCCSLIFLFCALHSTAGSLPSVPGHSVCICVSMHASAVHACVCAVYTNVHTLGPCRSVCTGRAQIVSVWGSLNLLRQPGQHTGSPGFTTVHWVRNGFAQCLPCCQVDWTHFILSLPLRVSVSITSLTFFFFSRFSPFYPQFHVLKLG